MWLPLWRKKLLIMIRVRAVSAAYVRRVRSGQKQRKLASTFHGDDCWRRENYKVLMWCVAGPVNDELAGGCGQRETEHSDNELGHATPAPQ